MVPDIAPQQRREEITHRWLVARVVIITLVAVSAHCVLPPRASSVGGGPTNEPAKGSKGRTQERAEVAAPAHPSTIECNPQDDTAGCSSPHAQPEPRGDSDQSSGNSLKITYANGQLTIKAINSSLADVLREVSAQTGAMIEFPPASVEERIFADLGPGSVRAVLASLLNGSQYNYVIVASENAPGTIQRMVLTIAERPHTNPSLPSPVQAPASVLQVQAPPYAAPKNGTPVAAQNDQQNNIDSSKVAKKPIPGEVLEQMYLQRIQQRRQGQPPQAGTQSPQ